MIVCNNTIVSRVALLKQNCYNKMKINRYFFLPATRPDFSSVITQYSALKKENSKKDHNTYLRH